MFFHLHLSLSEILRIYWSSKGNKPSSIHLKGMSQEGEAHGLQTLPLCAGEKARPEFPCSHTLTHHIGEGRKWRRWPYRKMALAPRIWHPYKIQIFLKTWSKHSTGWPETPSSCLSLLSTRLNRHVPSRQGSQSTQRQQTARQRTQQSVRISNQGLFHISECHQRAYGLLGAGHVNTYRAFGSM